MDYISELPEPYKTLAELRRILHHNATCTERTLNAEWMPDALGDAFVWDKTPERHDFWMAVERAETYADLPDIPKVSMMELTGMDTAQSVLDTQDAKLIVAYMIGRDSQRKEVRSEQG